MKELVEVIAKALVDKPEAVHVTEREEDGETLAIWRARLENKTESAAYLANLLGVSKSKVIRRLEKAIEKAKQKGL